VTNRAEPIQEARVATRTLHRVVPRLIEELETQREWRRRAEVLVALVSWNLPDPTTEDGRALIQAWADVTLERDYPGRTADWDVRIAELAQRRAEIIEKSASRLAAMREAL